MLRFLFFAFRLAFPDSFLFWGWVYIFRLRTTLSPREGWGLGERTSFHVFIARFLGTVIWSATCSMSRDNLSTSKCYSSFASEIGMQTKTALGLGKILSSKAAYNWHRGVWVRELSHTRQQCAEREHTRPA